MGKGGYFKVYRSMFDHSVVGFKDADAFRVWMWLLFKANYADQERFVSGEPVQLKRGEVMVTQGALARETGVTIKKVRNILGQLKGTKMVTIKRTQEGRYPSIISICNYDTFQGGGSPEGSKRADKRADKGVVKGPVKERNNKITNLDLFANAHKSCSNLVELDFDEIWKYYPRKVGKKKALEAWRKAMKGTTAEMILPALGDFIRLQRGVSDKSKIPHLATWLNGERWNDVQSDAVNEDRVSYGDQFEAAANQDIDFDVDDILALDKPEGEKWH